MRFGRGLRSSCRDSGGGLPEFSRLRLFGPSMSRFLQPLDLRLQVFLRLRDDASKGESNFGGCERAPHGATLQLANRV